MQIVVELIISVTTYQLTKCSTGIPLKLELQKPSGKLKQVGSINCVKTFTKVLCKF